MKPKSSGKDPVASPVVESVDVGGQPMPLWDMPGPRGGAAYADDRDHVSPLPLLFLHGLGLAPPAYRDILASLSGDRRVVAPFMPGLSWNRPVRTYTSHADIAGLILAVADRKGLARFHLAGQSTGGGVAAVLAANNPDRVASLTLIDASGLPQHASRRPVLSRARELVAETAEFGITRPGLGMARSFVTNLAFARGHMIRLADVPLTEDLSATFSRISARALILWGGNDLLFPPAAGEDMQGLIAGAHLHVVAGGRHSWEINRAAEAAALIGDHLAAVERDVETSHSPTGL